MSYCFETEGSVFESISLWWSVSGILNVDVIEKGLIELCLFNVMQVEGRLQYINVFLEARVACTSSLGKDMVVWRGT